MKLNLGCGRKKMDGWTNVDYYCPEADMKVDLFQFPWPWADSSVDAVATSNFLEHTENLIETISEVHRILKPNGLFWVIVPHGRGLSAYHPFHKQYFSRSSFQVISQNAQSNKHIWRPYGRPPMFWEQSYRVRLLNFGSRLRWTPFDWFASRFPSFWEKFIWIPPAEIEWKGRKTTEGNG